MIKKTYIVWYYPRFESCIRMGRTFKSKRAADTFVASLSLWQYFGTTVKIEIISDEVA